MSVITLSSPGRPTTVRRARAAHLRLTSILALSIAIAGCGSLPNDVAGPTISYGGDKPGVKARYVVNEISVVYGERTGGSSPILPVETSLLGIKSQISAMNAAYESRQRKLLNNVDTIGNLQFGGMIVSAIGIGISEIGTRNTGAGVAGLSNLWGNHYGVAVQANNYGIASQALKCVFSEVDGISDDFWNKAYDNFGVFNFPKSFFKVDGMSETDAAAAYDALSKMYIGLHGNVVAIDNKLRSLQAAVVVPAVSVADIQAAAKGEAAAKATDIATDRLLKAAAPTAVIQAVGKVQDAAIKADASRQSANVAKVESGEAQANLDATLMKFNKASKEKTRASKQLEHLRSEGEKLNSLPADGTVKAASKAENQEKLSKAIAAEVKAIEAAELLEVELNTSRDTRDKLLKDFAAATAKAAEDDAKKDAAEAEQKSWVAFKFLLERGLISAAILLPTKATTCITAMGK